MYAFLNALAREQGESILIGDDVTVIVLGVKGGQVRLGIAAPKETQYIAGFCALPHSHHHPPPS